MRSITFIICIRITALTITTICRNTITIRPYTITIFIAICLITSAIWFTWIIILSFYISIISAFIKSSLLFSTFYYPRFLDIFKGIRLYHLFRVPIIVVERLSVLEISMRLITQSFTILPYQGRYSIAASTSLYLFGCKSFKGVPAV